MKVSWDFCSQYTIYGTIKNVPNHQPDIDMIWIIYGYDIVNSFNIASSTIIIVSILTITITIITISNITTYYHYWLVVQ